MFRKIDPSDETLTVFIDGIPAAASPHESVAGVILRQDDIWNRKTAVLRSPRAAFCMMGVCFECLVAIDGQASLQGCLTQVSDGMRIERQQGKRKIG